MTRTQYPLKFDFEGMEFEIRQGPTGYVGWFDGKPSISSPRPSACFIGLIEKHVNGFTDAKVLNFADYAKRA